MSDHYIYLACTTPGCETSESIYTGEVYSDLFVDAGPTSWEGETIRVKCRACQAKDVDALKGGDDHE